MHNINELGNIVSFYSIEGVWLHIFCFVLSYPLRLLHSLPFLRSILFRNCCTILALPIFFSNNRLISMLKVSKQLYRSAQHDKVICK